MSARHRLAGATFNCETIIYYSFNGTCNLNLQSTGPNASTTTTTMMDEINPGLTSQQAILQMVQSSNLVVQRRYTFNETEVVIE